MDEAPDPLALRSSAHAAARRRMRAEFPVEYRHVYAEVGKRPNQTQEASKRLSHRHPERFAELYREECLARGLPEPKPRAGRWPR